MVKNVHKILFRNNSGFTLVEILISIGLLTVLLSTALIAVNPKHQFNIASDTRRKADLRSFHSALAQYFIDNRCLPTDTDWRNLVCGGEVPDYLKPYMADYPCDPDTNYKYYYQPLDNECKPCNGGCGVCLGYRLMASLRNVDDPAIRSSGCDPVAGCGVTDENGQTFNYQISSLSCKPSPTPTSTATPTPTRTPTPTPTPVAAGNCTSSTAFGAINNIDYWYAPGTSGQIHTDVDRLTHALEWYAVEHGNYPDCGCDGKWTNASECLQSALAPYLRDPAVLRTTYDYMRFATNNNSNGVGYDYCFAAPYAGYMSPLNSYCPAGSVNSSMGYFKKGPEGPEPKIPYSNIWPSYPLAVQEVRDATRRTNVDSIITALERYKQDNGRYPPVYMPPFTQYTNAENFSTYLSPYLSPVPIDPDGQHRYNIALWGNDGSGNPDKACVMSYMDKATDCSNTCGNPVAYWGYGVCYGKSTQ